MPATSDGFGSNTAVRTTFGAIGAVRELASGYAEHFSRSDEIRREALLRLVLALFWISERLDPAARRIAKRAEASRND